LNQNFVILGWYDIYYINIIIVLTAEISGMNNNYVIYDVGFHFKYNGLLFLFFICLVWSFEFHLFFNTAFEWTEIDGWSIKNINSVTQDGAGDVFIYK